MLWRSPSKPTFDANRAERVRSARHVLAVGEASTRHGPQRIRSWRSFCRASHCPSRLKVTHMYGPAVRCKRTLSGWR